MPKKSSQRPKAKTSKKKQPKPTEAEVLRAEEVIAERRFKHAGQPTLYTDEIANKICELMAEGKTLLRICKMPGMPKRRTVHNWLLHPDNKEFLLNYSLARELQADYWADEINDIADDGTNDYSEDDDGNKIVNHDHIKRSQLRVNTRQWNAARRAPKKWGDRSAVEMSGPEGGPAQVQIILPSNGREKMNAEKE